MESDELVLLIFVLDCSELFMGERLPEAVTDRESDDGVRFSGEFLERGDAEYVFWGLERNRRDGDGDGERGLLTLDALCSREGGGEFGAGSSQGSGILKMPRLRLEAVFCTSPFARGMVVLGALGATARYYGK
jgi:hypothetical protein